jgi:hypothetical protein
MVISLRPLYLLQRTLESVFVMWVKKHKTLAYFTPAYKLAWNTRSEKYSVGKGLKERCWKVKAKIVL